MSEVREVKSVSGENPALINEQERQRLLTALRESEILRELAELLASSLDLKRILQVLTKRTTEVCEVERCSVWLSDDSREVFHPAAYYLSSSDIDRKSIKAADHIWYYGSVVFDDPEIYDLLKEKGLVVVDDLHGNPRARRIAETFLVRSVLLVALKREGRIVGMLTLDDPNKLRTFSAEQQQLVRAIGQQAALAIDNARLYEQAQTERKRAERLIERAQAIYQVALTANSGENLKGILEIATQHLVRGLNADDGAIVLLDEGTETLYVVSHTNPQPEFFSSDLRVKLSDVASCYRAAMSGAPVFMQAQEAEDSELCWYRELELRNVLIVPLQVGSGQTIGFAIVSYQRASSPPGKGHIAFAQDIAAQCALAIEKARLLAGLRQAAALATERANTLDAVFQAMTEGITVLNQQGQLVASNKAATQFLGRSINGVDLATYLQHYPVYNLHGQRITEEEFPTSRALRGEHIRGERLIFIRRDGAERVIEINATTMLDDNKEQIGIVSAFRDVTEQTLVERRIREALETMLHVAEAVSGITDIQDILRSVLDRALSTLHCDRGLVQLYDESQQAFTPFLSIGFSETAEQEWLQYQSLWLPNGEGQKHSFRKQLMNGHATVINSQQWPYEPNPLAHLLVLAAPIMYHDRLLGVMMLDRSPTTKSGSLLARDQYEFSIWDMAVIEGIAQLAGLAIVQARWQQEVIEARTSEAAMREANALKDDFLAITAHEFRSPLTVILTNCQLALRLMRKMTDEQGSVQRVNDGLKAIEHQTHQLTSIVNTFLEATQLNRGQLVIKPEPVDIAEIAKQVVTNSSKASEKHEISSSIEPCEYPYLVRGEGTRLSQILANLIHNAIKYSPLGGPITITLRQYASDEETRKRTIEVCVADTGMGIPKEALPRLFERFYRAPNTQGSQTKGLGLGLYVVAELLRMHGGTIRAESSGILGEGSRFIFTLPALEDEVVGSNNERTTELAS